MGIDFSYFSWLSWNFLYMVSKIMGFDISQIWGYRFLRVSMIFIDFRGIPKKVCLTVYGFSREALNYIYSYLTNRRQRVNYTFNSLNEIEYGVPQGSILGPPFFNVNMCDLFFIPYDADIAKYAEIQRHILMRIA